MVDSRTFLQYLVLIVSVWNILFYWALFWLLRLLLRDGCCVQDSTCCFFVNSTSILSYEARSVHFQLIEMESHLISHETEVSWQWGVLCARPSIWPFDTTVVHKSVAASVNMQRFSFSALWRVINTCAIDCWINNFVWSITKDFAGRSESVIHGMGICDCLSTCRLSPLKTCSASRRTFVCR